MPASTASKRMLPLASGLAVYRPSPYLRSFHQPVVSVSFFGFRDSGKVRRHCRYSRAAPRRWPYPPRRLPPPPWRTSMPGCLPGVFGVAMTAKISELIGPEGRRRAPGKKDDTTNRDAFGHRPSRGSSRRISGGRSSRNGRKGSPPSASANGKAKSERKERRQSQRGKRGWKHGISSSKWTLDYLHSL